MADEGTFLHELVCTDDPRRDDLESEQLWALETAEKLTWKAYDKAGIPHDAPLLREVRLWAHHDLEPVFSGQMDRLAIHGKTGLFLDYKFGRIAVESAWSNIQLLGYGILGWLNYDFDEVFVAPIQPRRDRKNRLTIARYKSAQLAADYETIRAKLASTDTTLKAGKWCRYCPFIYCPTRWAHNTRIYS